MDQIKQLTLISQHSTPPRPLLLLSHPIQALLLKRQQSQLQRRMSLHRDRLDNLDPLLQVPPDVDEIGMMHLERARILFALRELSSESLDLLLDHLVERFTGFCLGRELSLAFGFSFSNLFRGRYRDGAVVDGGIASFTGASCQVFGLSASAPRRGSE